jgi:predicted XRE-type DNA-binding protein
MSKLRPAIARTPEALAEALGLSAAHARQWRIQHALLGKLKEIVRRDRITHTEIARRAGTSRTRVTAILNDRLDSVSTDLLIRMLGSLGYQVRVSVFRMDTAA